MDTKCTLMPRPTLEGMRRLVAFYLLLSATAAQPRVDPNAIDPAAVEVKCTTTKGDFQLTINPSWAPNGAARCKYVRESI